MSSFSYERYDRGSARNRGAFTYWVPLVVTVTVAAGGIAAWMWSARGDHESSGPSEDEDLSYGEENVDRRADFGRTDTRPPGYGAMGGSMPGPMPGSMPGAMPGDGRGDYRDVSGGRAELTGNVPGAFPEQPQDGTFFERVQGAIRRTPSPQQMMDIAGKRVVAGVAAAGAVVGTALGAIREEDRDYEDHERWSNQHQAQSDVTATAAQSAPAVAQHTEAFESSVRNGPSTGATARSGPVAGGKRKTVAVVVSGESVLGGLDEDEQGSYTTEEAVRFHSDAEDSEDKTPSKVLLRQNQYDDAIMMD